MSTIQWTDVTDNIIVAEGGGWWCRMISEGCANCYAAKLNQSDYFGGNHLPYTGEPPKLKLREDVIGGWARQRKPRKHFVASMTDIFGDWVPREWIFRFLDGQRSAHLQIFQNLTKRADIMAREVNAWLDARGLNEAPGNMQFGTSVENQKRADERIPDLLKVRAKVLFLSCEPLLGPIILPAHSGRIDSPGCISHGDLGDWIRWVIIGGESGPGARPCNLGWIRSLALQCKTAGVATFVKQLGADPRIDLNGTSAFDGSPVALLNAPLPKALKDKKGGDMAEWPADLRVREFPV